MDAQAIQTIDGCHATQMRRVKNSNSVSDQFRFGAETVDAKLTQNGLHKLPIVALQPQ